ncbi:hypothetical protein H6G13_02050 [Pseudanabaena sp. FACHB-2040]|nr:hypothetical protein [Pseudanabaena sp. FACHB-2040]
MMSGRVGEWESKYIPSTHPPPSLSLALPACYHANVLPASASRDGVEPGDAIAIMQHRHAVDRLNNSGIVAQQNVAEFFGLVRR